jgi:hypothetical protein
VALQAPERLAGMLIEMPVLDNAVALIIGHPRDPVHPFSDVGMLAAELPDARLLHARSILELRVRPKRLTADIAGFVDGCWEAGVGASGSAAVG